MENRLVVAKGERELRRRDWEFGISRCKLSCVCGLKGDKPPVEFGERTRDCSLCHTGMNALISR